MSCLTADFYLDALLSGLLRDNAALDTTKATLFLTGVLLVNTARQAEIKQPESPRWTRGETRRRHHLQDPIFLTDHLHTEQV